MTSTKTDHRPTLYRSFEQAAEIVAGVRSDQLPLATVCPQYDVATLVDHIVGAGHRVVTLGRGETPSGDEFPHVELADAPAELREAGRQAQAAWADDARLAGTVVMPWGEAYDGTTVVNMYSTELAGHAWDIAAATGQSDRLNLDLGASALDAARAMLKPEYRDLVEPGSPFGQEIPAPAGATDWERLAAFTGRPPRA